MKNLKRVLSLGLASVMLLGMMVMGASAANFSDEKDIKNTEAVNTMVALNVILGKDDGRFDPNGTVTRGEMAKMITMIMFGGEEPVLTVGSTPKFSDVTTHWARKYIEYCASQGIIAGMGDGTFAPDGKVTGTAAAKMALVAIGYDAKVYGFEGNRDWELNINGVANRSENNLFEGLRGLNPSEPLTRDQAAQILFNALDAVIVEPQYTVTNNGTEITYIPSREGTTMLEKKFGAGEVEGVLFGVTYDADEKEYTYSIATDNDITGATAAKNITDLTTEADFTNLFGRKVRVLRTTNTDGDTTNVFGIYDISKTVVEATVADLALADAAGDSKVEVNGTKYDLAAACNTIKVYTYDGASTHKAKYTSGEELDDIIPSDPDTDPYKPASSVVLISSDNDKNIDYVVVTPVTVAKVTYKGSESLVAGGSHDLKKDDVEDGLKKGDWATVILKANTFNGKNVVRKANIVNGTVSARRAGEVRVNGEWLNENGIALTLGSEYNLVVVGKTIYNADKISGDAAIDEIVLVTDPQNVAFGVSRARLYFTDGTNKIVDVSKVGAAEATKPDADKLYTYKVNKDGNYELTLVDATNKAGTDTYDTTTSSWVASTKKLGSYFVDDDAVVFVKNTGGTGAMYKVFTGADVNKWANHTMTGSAILSTTNAGMSSVKLALLTSATMPANDGSTKYGYVISKPEQIMEGNTKYWSYTIWTADGEVDVLDQATSPIVTDKNKVISYTDLGDGKIDTTSTGSKGVDLTTSAVRAITGIKGDNLTVIKADGTADTVIKTDKNTQILYVDSKNVAGANGGEIAVADRLPDGSAITNAWVVAASDTSVAKVIVYDVNNDIANFANDAANGTAGFAVAAATLASAPVAGWDIRTDRTKACQGDKVTVTITSDGTGTETSAATAVTGIDATVANVALTATTATSYTIEFIAEDEAVTAITVTLS